MLVKNYIWDFLGWQNGVKFAKFKAQGSEGTLVNNHSLYLQLWVHHLPEKAIHVSWMTKWETIKIQEWNSFWWKHFLEMYKLKNAIKMSRLFLMMLLGVTYCLTDFIANTASNIDPLVVNKLIINPRIKMLKGRAFLFFQALKWV